MSKIKKFLEELETYEMPLNYRMLSFKKKPKKGIVIEMDILYKEKAKHRVTLKYEGESLYWFINPYNNSYFSASFEHYNEIEDVLFVIKEHTDIHMIDVI